MNPGRAERTRKDVSLRVSFFASAAITLVVQPAYGDSATSLPNREPQKLGVFADTSYLASAAGNGVAVSSGLRLALGAHAALGADLGYGVLAAPSAAQDRWWILPTLAWVIPTGPWRLDLGAGLGVGASSGYASLGAYTAGPFSPTWAFQLVPAARAHVMGATSVSRDIDLFVRLEAATLVLSGTPLGFRHGNTSPGSSDTTWFDVGAGLQFRVL
jgi:hypothetical protein